VLQGVAMCCNVRSQRVVMMEFVSVLQCVAVCRNVLQCALSECEHMHIHERFSHFFPPRESLYARHSRAH